VLNSYYSGLDTQPAHRVNTRLPEMIAMMMIMMVMLMMVVVVMVVVVVVVARYCRLLLNLSYYYCT
ncbi:hypothetical protein, partial [Nocardioides malaquae]|uniref:hypothetical protein n=1 Tax=Nocardioides malaquae TaxID=2773426 RepID=UPI001D0D0FF9